MFFSVDYLVQGADLSGIQVCLMKLKHLFMYLLVNSASRRFLMDAGVEGKIKTYSLTIFGSADIYKQ